MNDDVDELLVALRTIAGATGERDGFRTSDTPCRTCRHPNCVAARALFDWYRRQFVNAIGKDKLP